MKKSVLRIFALVLALLMTLPLIIACGNDGKDPASSGNSGNNNAETHRDSLPELDYGGEDVNFLSRSFDWYVNEVTIDDGDTSDIVNAAVFKREATVEDRLNINIVNTKLDGSGSTGYYLVTESIRQEVLAGTNDYDIGVNNMYHTLESAGEGLFWDMNKVANVDLSKEYYSQNFNYTGTVSGKLFAVTGDASLTFIKFAFATFFNRDMAEELKIPDLYQTVLDGNWTLEYQSTVSKDVYTDATGDGKKTEDDTYGLYTNAVLGADPYLSAFDLPMVTKDASGKLQTAVNVDKVANALKMINQYFYQSQGVYVSAHLADDAELVNAAVSFAGDRCLFMTNRLYICEDASLRNMESLYGIVPMPKFDTNQQQYYSYCHDLMSVFVVSSAVPESRLPMVGATLECFFSESKDCRYKLFEEALKVKYQSTEKTGRMLDIIIDNVMIDTGMVYSGAFSDAGLFLRNLVQKRSSSFAGYWKMQSGSFSKAMTKLEDDFNKLK